MECAAEPMHVLIVDDNQPVAKALAALMQRAGYHTAVFHTGGEALEYVQHYKPCAAVIDIHLPDISGLVLSHQLRQRLGPQAPIIVLSGDSSMENLNSLAHVGATCFFSKPVKADHLVQRLKELVA